MAAQEEDRVAKEQKRKIQAEKKKLATEQKKQKREAKARAKELAAQEAELETDSAGSMVSAFFVTFFLIIIWLAILALVIKLDLGGLGTNVMAPILKDIPVLNKILPADSITETEDLETYYGYSSLKDAVDQIRVLEEQLKTLQESNDADEEQIASLTAEIERLKTFEANQVEFERVEKEFYEQVVYSDESLSKEAFKEYYQSMDPDTAEFIYRQVITEENYSTEIKEYAQAYSEMKPKEAAGIFEAMTDNLDLAAKILEAMEPDDRGKILGAMDAQVAAKITKIMEPNT